MREGVPGEFEAMHYEPKSGEFFYNPRELKLFETNEREKEMLAAARGQVEAMLVVADVQEARGAREGMPFKPGVGLLSNPHLPLLAEQYKWKLGNQLTRMEREQLVRMLEENSGEFAFSLEELGGYTGEPMEIEVDTNKPIFTLAHRLSAAEWESAGKHCEELEKLGMIRSSKQNKYASPTVVVKKKDEAGEYTDYRQCGDYRPINSHTPLDRYPLPRIDISSGT